MTNNEYNRQLQKEKGKRITYIIVGVIGVALFLFIPVIGLILIILATFLFSRSKKMIKEEIGAKIAQDVIGRYIDDLIYDPHGSFDTTIINGIYMDFPNYDRIHSNDLIKGTYKGHRLMMCDLRLSERQTTSNGRGTRTHYVTVFAGPYIAISFDKTITSSVTVSHHRFFSQGNIKMESEHFNENYNVTSESEHDAFYILTPQMMERIERINALAGDDIYICFDHSGFIYIAVNNDQNNFEISFDHDDTTKIKEDFDKQFIYILRFIDELLEGIH